MKKTVLSFLACLFLFSGSLAAQDYIGYYPEAHRALVMTVNNKKIKLVAPKNMCFMDKTNYAHKPIFELEEEAAVGRKVLAVFANCDELPGFGKKRKKTNAMPQGITSGGTFTWMYPAYPRKIKKPLSEFLDEVEANYLTNTANYNAEQTETRRKGNSKAYAESHVPTDDIRIHEPKRTEHAVIQTLYGTNERFGEIDHFSTVTGATLIDGLPMSIEVTFTGKEAVLKRDLELFAKQSIEHLMQANP